MSNSNPDSIEYFNYNNKLVRAIAWILKSPGLLSKPVGETSQLVMPELIDRLTESFLHEWLMELDNNPQQLQNWINEKPSFRLGIRFERLLSFVFNKIQQQGKIENLNFNIPVYDEAHQTLGELDIVYFDKLEQQRFHWENAVKFYLFRPEEYSFERWVGPNGSDWLQRKTEHLFLRQLGISNSAEGKIALSNCFNSEQNNSSLNKMAFIKGYLFKPLGSNCEYNFQEKELINSLSEIGWWAYSDQFHLADPEQMGRWRVVEKLDWIVPQIYPYHDDDMLKPSEMSLKVKYHFSQSKRSLMLAHFELDEMSQMWVEKDRGVLVDKLWPSYRKN